MKLETQVSMIEEFLGYFYPVPFPGNVQSCYFYQKKDGKPGCAPHNLTYDQISGREPFKYGSYNYSAGYLPKLLAKSTNGEYITVNIKKSGSERRCFDDFQYCGGIPLDIDKHDSGITEEEREKSVSDTVVKVLKAVDEKIFPEPTIIMVSGRGVQMHYRFLDLVPAGEYFFVHSIWQEIGKQWIEYIGDSVEMDSSVGDMSRLMRIPGTFNPKSDSFAYTVRASGKLFTPLGLCHHFGLDTESLRTKADEDKESWLNKHLKSVKKEVKKAGKTTTKRHKAKAARTLMSDEIFQEYETGKLRITCYGVDRIIKEMYIKMMNHLLQIREDWTKHRDLFLHIYYNLILYFVSKPKADEICMEVWETLCQKSDPNDRFGEDEAIHIIDTFRTNIYDYKKLETFIKKLDITKEELKECGMGKKFEKEAAAKIAAENNKLRNAKRTLVCRYWAEGMKMKEIPKLVNEQLGLLGTRWECNYEYVHRYIGKYGVKKNDPRFINSEIEAAYKRSGQKIGQVSAYQCEVEIDGGLLDDAPLAPAQDDRKLESLTERKLTAETGAKPAFTFDKDAEEAYQEFLSGRCFHVLGEGGTGKSRLIDRIRESCKASGRSYMVLAPTGTAASNVNGKTIHSALGLNAEDDLSNPTDEFIMASARALKNADSVLIDECGFVRNDLALYLIKAVLRAEELRNKPIQLIWLGDFMQLPPVYLDGEDSRKLFEIPEWREVSGKKIVLRTNHRIKDPEFLNVLNMIRSSRNSSTACRWLNSRCISMADDNGVYIVPRCNDARNINLMQIQTKFRNAEKKVYETTDSAWNFAVGMRVMVTRNHGDSYQNGSLGVVEVMNKKSVRVRLDKGKSVLVAMDRDGILPLVPAYALTVHKAQGQTLDSVNIIPGFFAPGQLYTALSRVKNHKCIHLLGKIRLSDVIVDRRAYEYQHGETGSKAA